MKILFKLNFLFLFLTHLGVFSQEIAPADSLLKQLVTEMPDTSRVILLDQIARRMMYSNPEEAMKYGKQGLTLAEKIDFEKGISRSLNRVGAIQCLFGDYEKGLSSFIKGLRISEKINDIEGLNKITINIGVLYIDQKDYQSAIESFKKSEILSKKMKDENLLQLCYLNLGTIFSLKKQYDSAQFYTKKAYKMSLKLKNEDINVILMNLGDLNYDKQNYKEAKKFYIESFGYSEKFHDKRILAQSYYNMALVFYAENNRDSSLYYAEKSFKLCREVNNLKYLAKSALLLSKMAEKNNPALALKYFKEAVAANDSMFNEDKDNQIQNLKLKEKMLTQELDFAQKEFSHDRKMGILATVLGFALVFLVYQFMINRQKQKVNVLLIKQKDEIQTQKTELIESLTLLKTTQEQLIQKEKLASLGELTAGIAHEIQNPLNFVNNFSEINTELASEIKAKLENLTFEDKDEVDEILTDMITNQDKIWHHGKRASSIVKNMLEHSRSNSDEVSLVDLNHLVMEFANLSYHGLRAKDHSFNSNFELILDKELPTIKGISQDLGRVFLNLINNAFYATNKQKILCEKLDEGYKPLVKISSQKVQVTENGKTVDYCEIKISDNGIGIEKSVMNKIFQPFFTTKPTGEGTGLGLSLSYDIIVKRHRGSLVVDSEAGKGSTFTIKLPIINNLA